MRRKLKEIFKYLIRVLFFLLLNRRYMLPAIMKIIDLISLPFPNNDDWILVAMFVFPAYIYLTIKLCGLFKKLDNLNFFVSLVVVCFVDILFNISDSLIVQIFPLKFSFYKSAYLCLVLPCFVLYKIFYFLSKKFPNPFQKIEYYTSIEFYKRVLSKIKSKFINQ